MPYRAHGHRRGTVTRERIASLAPRTGDRCSFTHRDRGAVGSLALRASRAPPFPSAPATLLEPHRARAAARQAPGMSVFRGIGGEVFPVDSPFRLRVSHEARFGGR